MRETRDLQARADAIEDAVYDLKAVNPYAKSDQDTVKREVARAARAPD